MTINRYLGFIVFLLLLSLASSSFISDANFVSQGSIGRSLLQKQKDCPVNFQDQNYTIITSQCKGPNYPKDACCKAFKEFACPFAEDLNDLSNKCASTMFSYINLSGNYPSGLFANMCKEDKNGLECDENSSANAVSRNSKANSAHTANVLSPVVVISVASLVSMFCLF